jgi:ribosome-interacting GTPase 1
LIDHLEGNRRYIRGLFVYNKIDTISMEDVDLLSRQPHSVCISISEELGTDFFLEKMWEYLNLVRIYTKKVRVYIKNINSTIIFYFSH